MWRNTYSSTLHNIYFHLILLRLDTNTPSYPQSTQR